MDLPQSSIYESTDESFVVRVWIEQASADGHQTQWRGHITHIPSGDAQYFKDLAEVPLIMASHLQQMGVKMGFGWRVRQWLVRLLI